MAAKAHISNGYRWRLGIMSLVCLALGGWFLYDGSITYPERRDQYQAYIRVMEDYPRDEREQRWEEIGQAEGWSTGWWTAEPAEYTQWDIRVQFICAAIAIPPGLLFGFFWWRAGSRWVACDEQGLLTDRGERAAWDALHSVDKTRWKKGIAVVHYRDAQGGERRITLDDWKFEAEPTRQILAEVETHLGLAEEESDAVDAPLPPRKTDAEEPPPAEAETEPAETDRT